MVECFVQPVLHHLIDPRGEELLHHHIQSRTPKKVTWEAPLSYTADNPRSAPGTEVHLQVRSAHRGLRIICSAFYLFLGSRLFEHIQRSSLVLYLLSNSTDIHSNITSRVPNPNHHHSFPLHIVSTAIIPAVKIVAFKALNT